MTAIDRTGDFGTRAIAVLMALAVLFGGLFLVLSAYGSDLRGGRDGGAHALSVSGNGFSGLAALAAAGGIPTRVARDDSGRGAAGVLVLTPPQMQDPQSVADIIKARHGDPVLIILPKWTGQPDPLHPGWITNAFTIDGVLSASALRMIAPGVHANDAPLPPGTPVVDGDGRATGFTLPDRVRTLSGPPELVPVVSAGGRMLAGSLPAHNLYIVADPDLLDNHGLRNLAAARSALTLLRDIGAANPGGLVFDVTLNGFGRTRSLLRTALEPPFLALTLAFVAAAILAAWHAWPQFGTPEPAPRAIAFGKQALVNNAAGLIRLAGRGPRMARRYAALIREATAIRLGAPRTLQDEALNRWLEAKRGGNGFAALFDDAAAAATPDRALAAAQALFRKQQELIDER